MPTTPQDPSKGAGGEDLALTRHLLPEPARPVQDGQLLGIAPWWRSARSPTCPRPRWVRAARYRSGRHRFPTRRPPLGYAHLFEETERSPKRSLSLGDVAALQDVTAREHGL